MSINQKIVALVGQPNVGKTTLFNALTGMTQRVGNWPGVTVEKKEGVLKYKDTEFNIVDLPGIYSLKSDSLDQKISRDFIIENEDSILVDVLDTNNINRNLYLTLQLIELGRSPIICLNFIDETEKHDAKIDEKKLSKKLGGLPVIKTSGRYKIGIEDLKETIYNYKPVSCEIKYSELLENAIEKIMNNLDEYITNIDEKFKKVPKRYLALAFLEGDPEVVELFKKNEDLLNHANKIKEEIEREIKHDIESYVVEQRYNKADEILKGIWTENIVYDDVDKILLHPIYGFVIFAFIMYILYSFVMGLGNIFIGPIEMLFEYLGEYVGRMLPEAYRGVVVDGIIGGVGGVLVFFPYIAFMMLSLAILEDCGYLSRVTALFHNVMAKIGLSGSSIIPIMVSFGCTVPGLMTTRGMSNPMKRLITILVAPLVPCSARFVVIGFMATAFFSQYAGLFALSIVLISLSLMGIMAYLISKLIVKGEPEEPIFELPPYRLPDWNYIFKRTWAHSKSFLRRAGTVILAASILFYYLLNYPNPDNSYGIMLGKMLEPITLLMGIDWRGTLALIFGITAKELVVSTMKIAYNGDIVGALTPLKAFVLTLVTVVYVPCLATIATIHYETNNLKWTLFAVGYNLVLATTLGIVAYNVGRLLGFS